MITTNKTSQATDLNKKELRPIHDNAKSFYNKAYYTYNRTKTRTSYEGDFYYDEYYTLYSYGVPIATISITYNNYDIDLINYEIICNKATDLTRTTMRHLKEFLQQFITEQNGLFKILYK